MQIYLIEDKAVIERMNQKDYFILINFQIEKEDYVVLHNTFYEYHSEKDGCCVIRKCDMVDSVSRGEIELFKAMTTSYCEMPDISITLEAFKNLTIERFWKSLSDLLMRVKQHGKINEKEVLFLFEILSGNQSKKQAMRHYNCTLCELENAYKRFIDEMQWCYGYLKPYLEQRVQQFFGGVTELLWDPASFLAHYQLGKSFLKTFLQNLLRSDFLLKKQEQKDFLILFEKFCNNEFSDCEERMQLVEFSKQITTRFHSEVKTRYLQAAQWLIEEKKIYIADIKSYSRLTGYSEFKLYSALRKKGVRPNHRNKRFSELLKQKQEEEAAKKKIFIVTGFPCMEKTALLKEALKEFPSIVRIVSDTTRKPRTGEKDGIDYHFVSVETFKTGVIQDEYSEYIFFGQNYYGIKMKYFRDNCDNNIALALNIKGMERIKQLEEDAVTIFVCPPSIEELKRRMMSQGHMTSEEVKLKLDKVNEEIENGISYDYFVVNDDFDRAVRDIISILSKHIN